MFNDPQVYLTGYLAQEPKFKTVAGDISCVELRVAYTPRRRNSQTGEWSDKATTFVNVQCWRQLADNVTMSLRKGEPVLVMGRLRIRSYNDAEGKSRTAVEVEASSVGHDLTRGVAHFSRAHGPVGGRATEVAEVANGHAVAGHDPDGVPDLAGQPSGAQNGAVLDEQAVAEFARELSALGGDNVAGVEPEPAVDAEAEPAASPQS